MAAWVKNHHLGFEITYSFRGIIRKFRPDYLVRLANLKMFVLEVKGQDNQQQQTKREFLAEWVKAVNGQRGFGTWASDVSRQPMIFAKSYNDMVSRDWAGQQPEFADHFRW